MQVSDLKFVELLEAIRVFFSLSESQDEAVGSSDNGT